MSLSCKPFSITMIDSPRELRLDDVDLTLESARRAADAAARALDDDPMLISWYEAQSGRHSPRVECCRDDKPGWLAYAESRGGSLVFSVNDASYVFVYAPLVAMGLETGGRQ
ncbi:MAG: AF1514 family protein [Syntrophobacteraceae bacterium]|jgi:hypothetical protein|nr:AF1514 family protein [Syntrophobacteraceae bacterium]